MCMSSISTQWLERYSDRKNHYLVSLDDDPVVKEIRNFLLLWNLYENLFLNCSGKVCSIWKNTGNLAPDIKDTDAFYAYIKDRYSDPILFAKLNFKHDDKGLDKYCTSFSDRVLAILGCDEPSLAEKNTVCRMVAWRYRNNLFHGKKSMSSFWNQQDIFERVNAYLVSGLSIRTKIYVDQ